jgi:ferric-dicitrate binding protein FerR (iron transport regulator)
MERPLRAPDEASPLVASRGASHEVACWYARASAGGASSGCVASRAIYGACRCTCRGRAGGGRAFAAFFATRTHQGPPRRWGAEFVTDTAEMATARLDDGSVVRLAPRSRLRVSHAAHVRESWLDGEAYFAVAHDKARPFRVRTRAGTVEVLGTRFDLRVAADDARHRHRGRVALHGDRGASRGDGGEMGTVGTDGRINRAGTACGRSHGFDQGLPGLQDTPLHQSPASWSLRSACCCRQRSPNEVTAWLTSRSQTLLAICRPCRRTARSVASQARTVRPRIDGRLCT